MTLAQRTIPAPVRRTRKPRVVKCARSENAIQRDIVDYLRAVLDQNRFVIYANANASRRTASGKASNGVPGLQPGIPDLSVLCPGGQMRYFEVKRAGGVLSEAQRVMINRFIPMGVPYAVVHSIDEVRVALDAWKIVTREVRL